MIVKTHKTNKKQQNKRRKRVKIMQTVKFLPFFVRYSIKKPQKNKYNGYIN